MPILAILLSRAVGGPVTDSTGLTAKYDIDLKWSPDDAATTAATTATTPQDPAGPSIFTAVQELGLRLEPKKTRSRCSLSIRLKGPVRIERRCFFIRPIRHRNDSVRLSNGSTLIQKSARGFLPVTVIQAVSFLQVDLKFGKASVGENFAMLRGGQQLQADFCGLLFEEAGDRRIRTLVHFGDQDERAAWFQHTPDFAQSGGDVRPPEVRLDSSHQIERVVRERKLPDIGQMNLDAARPDCLRVVAPGRGNTLLRVVNSVDLPLRRHAANLLMVRPPPQPTSSTVNRDSTVVCVRPQSVSFEWLLFIRHRVKRPKNPEGLLH